MKANKRATEPDNTERDRQRIDAVRSILLDGAESWDVRHFVAEKNAAGEPPWQEPVSDQELAGYAAAAEKIIAASCDNSEAKNLKRHLAQRRNLYAKALQQNDCGVALSCLRDEARLLGLYERQKKVPRAKALTGTPGDVAALLAETIQQIGQGLIDARTASTIGGLAAMLLKVRGPEPDDASLLEMKLMQEASAAGDEGAEAADEDDEQNEGIDPDGEPCHEDENPRRRS
jgi:hypothetical protein